MKRLFFVVLLCLLAAVIFSSFACENRSATEDDEEGEASGDIEADNDKWLDTEVEVEPGGSMHITATGTVRLNPNGIPIHPDGSEIELECGEDCPMPEAPAGALIGQIELLSEKFLVGAEFMEEMEESGTLYLVVNDDSYDDNEGAYSVEIFYTPPETADDDGGDDDDTDQDS